LNFLLHRYLASRDLASPTAGIGAMLPDIWRMADRRVRPGVGTAPPSEDAGPELDAILKGIDHHIQSDTWFHLSRMLLDGERLTADRLRECRIDAPKLGLFSHIGWELLLDGALLRREGLEPTVRAIRAGFGIGTGGPADRAAGMHHFDRVERTVEERSAFAAGVRRLFEEIGRGPWIESYLRGGGIARTIQGIRVRLGFPPFSERERARIGSGFEELAPAADMALEQILAHGTPADNATHQGAPAAGRLQSGK
jgi:hypothetical protein